LYEVAITRKLGNTSHRETIFRSTYATGLLYIQKLKNSYTNWESK
jgi:hypothetical protein